MSPIAAGYTSLVLSIDQVADVAYGVLFRGESLATAIAIAKAESEFEAHSYLNNVPLGGKGLDRGLWQINSHYHSEVSDAVAYDPAGAARETYRISKGGTDWSPWTTFDTGAYRNHLAAAREAATAREQRGGSGSISGGGNTPTTVPAARTPDVVLASSPLPLSIARPMDVGELFADNAAGDAVYIADRIVGGQVDLTSEEASEVSVQLYNEALALVGGSGRSPVAIGQQLSWHGLSFASVASELRQGGGAVEYVDLTLRSWGVQELKDAALEEAGIRRVDAYVKNMSPTEYAEQQARRVGLRFHGQGTARRTDIAPTQLSGEKAGRVETIWEVLRRLAGDEGCLVFESAGILHFAKPSWLADHSVVFKVGWRNGWADPRLDANECPRIRQSLNDKDGATIEVTVPRWRGEQIRPGMRLDLAGVAGVPDRYLVSRVGWSLNDPTSPVTIEGREPIDPPVQEPETQNTAPQTSPPSTPAASPPVAGRGPRISQAERIKMFGQPGDRARITSVSTPWGITVQVHVRVKDRFLAACAAAAAASSWKPRRIDSYNKRNVRGGTEWSLHSWPLAWDFFSSPPNVTPPGGVWAETSAPDAAFRNAFKGQGFYLGAEFSRRKDYPHVEWASEPPAS